MGLFIVGVLIGILGHKVGTEISKGSGSSISKTIHSKKKKTRK